jgi:hypothetical protein
MNARQIVETLLDPVSLCEASVHKPRRGNIWVATYTGPDGRQIWRSTGLESQDQALRKAKAWEAQARRQRIHNPERGHPAIGDAGGLTQSEVADLLGMAVRGVRAAEARAIRKLKKHPIARQLWQDRFGR